MDSEKVCRSMRIVYCIAGTYNSGGMERVLSNKANYLVSHGYEVAIVTTDQRGAQPFFRLDPRIRCIDLNINYELNNGKSFFNKLFFYPFKQRKHRIALTKVLNDLSPDITVSMFCNEVSFLPSIKDGSKKILEAHFSRFKRLQYGRKGLWRMADVWRNHKELRQVSHFDKFVTLTREDFDYWGEQKNMVVIPNARTFTCEHPAALKAKVVVAVGRYAFQKGFDMLLQAWSQVCKQERGWELHIVGEGELRDTLNLQIEILSLRDKVKLCPPTLDICQVYMGASFLVMSSRYEGFGMVLLEAQTVGLPVVSFDCKCGPSEIIEDGVTGFLVPSNDVNQLAEKMLVLIRDEELRKSMGKKGFKASSRFTEEKVMRHWMNLFDELQGIEEKK